MPKNDLIELTTGEAYYDRQIARIRKWRDEHPPDGTGGDMEILLAIVEYMSKNRVTQAAQRLEIEQRMLNIARGCFDYGGGHHDDGKMDAFHHGIQTVVNALEAATKHDPNDHQVNALEAHGARLLTEPGA